MTKHDGYAVFAPDGSILHGTNHMHRERCETLVDEFLNGGWSFYESRGYVIKPVTITEVKDDE